MAEFEPKKTPLGKPFQKGESGNPGGRPRVPAKIRKAFREAAQGYAIEALETIAEAMRNKKTSVANRLKAANYLLDRGMGRPVVYQDVFLEDRTEQKYISPMEVARLAAFFLVDSDRVFTETEN